jgi:hypothetical protein
MSNVPMDSERLLHQLSDSLIFPLRHEEKQIVGALGNKLAQSTALMFIEILAEEVQIKRAPENKLELDVLRERSQFYFEAVTHISHLQVQEKKLRASLPEPKKGRKSAKELETLKTLEWLRARIEDLQTYAAELFLGMSEIQKKYYPLLDKRDKHIELQTNIADANYIIDIDRDQSLADLKFPVKFGKMTRRRLLGILEIEEKPVVVSESQPVPEITTELDQSEAVEVEAAPDNTSETAPYSSPLFAKWSEYFGVEKVTKAKYLKHTTSIRRVVNAVRAKYDSFDGLVAEKFGSKVQIWEQMEVLPQLSLDNLRELFCEPRNVAALARTLSIIHRVDNAQGSYHSEQKFIPLAEKILSDETTSIAEALPLADFSSVAELIVFWIELEAGEEFYRDEPEETETNNEENVDKILQSLEFPPYPGVAFPILHLDAELYAQLKAKSPQVLRAAIDTIREYNSKLSAEGQVISKGRWMGARNQSGKRQWQIKFLLKYRIIAVEEVEGSGHADIVFIGARKDSEAFFPNKNRY